MIGADNVIERKLTAEQIEKNCPERLRQIGEEIRLRLAEIDKETPACKRVLDHGIAVEKLLTEAKELCDAGGLKKFHQIFCPQLGKTQAYRWLAVAIGKKTLSEVRTEERERRRRTRAKQREAGRKFRDVPENNERESGTLKKPADAAPVDTLGTSRPTALGIAVMSGSAGVSNFTAFFLELKRKIGKKQPKDFAGTGVPAHDLTAVGKFLLELAEFKLATQTKANDQSNGLVTAEQSAAA